MYINKDEIGGFVTEWNQSDYNRPFCYWSSTVYNNYNSKRWYVNFYYGNVDVATIEQFQLNLSWVYYQFGTRPVRKDNNKAKIF